MVKCRVCKQPIVIYCMDNGGIVCLSVQRGFAGAHLCGEYEDMLSKYMCKKLGIKNGEAVA